MSEKLQQAQKEQARLTKELSITKIDLLKLWPSKNIVTNASNGVTIGFEEAVLTAADKEDAAFLAIDNYLSNLRLISYSMFINEYGVIKSKFKENKNTDVLTILFTDCMATISFYHNFNHKLESLRINLSKRIREHYRQKLKKFEQDASVAFFSEVRQQPQILIELGQLVKELKSIEDSKNWNTNATKTIKEFISTNSSFTDVENKTDVKPWLGERVKSPPDCILSKAL